MQVVEAAAAHQEGIIHRDIGLTTYCRGLVKVLIFGIAKLVAFDEHGC